MRNETQRDLSEETGELLRELIVLGFDTAAAFAEMARKIKDSGVASALSGLSRQREEQAEELRRQLTSSLGQSEISDRPRDAGGPWIDLRYVVSGGDPYVMLFAAVRGDELLQRRYERALAHTPGTPLNRVLLRQYGELKGQSEVVRRLRDSLEAA